MIDLAFVRANLPLVEEKLRARGMDPAAVLGDFAQIDLTRREAITRLETLKAQRNKLTEEIAKLRRSGADATALTEETRLLKAELESLEGDAAEADNRLRNLMQTMPNLQQDDVPAGRSADDNVEVKTWGKIPTFDFPARSHWEIGEALGILDFNRAAKISGSRFVVHFGQGAQLERALANFMLDLHTREHGYTEVLPPSIVNSKSLFGTGQLPKFADELFHCDDKGAYVPGQFQDSDHWLIPTAEVPVTNLFRDETLEDAQLPISFCAYSPCFRSEAGSYGKDVRGMIRQHQFQKVELVKFTRPEDSAAAHEQLTRHAETVLESLGLPYRRMLLCTGDMSPSSSKTYDLEVWLPGQQLYREISSCSNFLSFQARRANIRYKAAGAKKPEFLHTLNGSGLAIGRTYLAILENYQLADGTVRIPDVLIPYMNGQTVIGTQPGKELALPRQPTPAAQMESTSNPLTLLRRYLFWTYERGSMHYDVMVTLILLFLFLAPHYVDFGDKPVATVPLRASEVLVKEAGTRGSRNQFIYEIRADQKDGGPNATESDSERRAAILRMVEPIAGEVTLDHYDPILDAKGKVVAYDAWILR